MPHKHTRKGEDKTSIDLPPSVIAKPLPVSKSANANGIFTSEINSKRSNKKRKRNKDVQDDTPKAFARLMAFQRGEKLPKGLDDGVKISKAERKRKRAEAEDGDGRSQNPASDKDIEQEKEIERPTIRVGEKMSEFSARVDAALPLSGLINKTAKGGKDPLGLKVGRTKKEKKMHKMYAEWREQDKKIKEKREEALELAEEEAEDSDGQVKWKVDIDAGKSKGGKKKKRKKVIGEVDVGEDDPWAQIKRNRAEKKAGLHDVVLAPPSFAVVPREKFKDRGVNNVPKESGSLRRREELGVLRRGIVEEYRARVKGGRGEIGQE